MGDPFSIGVGVVGVISLTIQITQVMVSFGLDWKEVPDTIRSFMAEMGTLKTVLSETNSNIIANPDFRSAFQQQTSVLLSELGPNSPSNTETKIMLEVCQKSLESLLKDLKERQKGHRLGWERLKGAFLAKDTRESVQSLSRQCQHLNSMVSIDTLVLGAATYTEIKEGRKEQKEWHEADTKISLGIRERVDKSAKHQEDQRNEEKMQRILTWISPIDFATEQSDIIRNRQEGTGQWLLDCEEFQSWIDTDQQTLFCPGIPGAGKTILTATVIDHLIAKFADDPTVGMGYIFCNFRRQQEQNAMNLLQTLLRQFTRGLSDIPDPVRALYDKHKNASTHPSFVEVTTMLKSVLALYSKAFIIVDALDEFQAQGGGRTTFLAEIFNLQALTGVKFFATSRPNLDIEMQFKNCPTREIIASDEDIRKYLDENIQQLPHFVSKRPQLQEEIRNEISGAVEGMFLLAQLYMKALEDKTTPKIMRTALQQFRKRAQEIDDTESGRLEILSQAYNQAMERINGQNAGFRKLANDVLSWITCAVRPLTTSELQHALAVEVGDVKVDEDNIPDIESILSVCAGLVILDEESNIIRLVHYTTQEYFERTKDVWFLDVETRIADICTTYLSFDCFEMGAFEKEDTLLERRRIHPLCDYAVHNWGCHARKASSPVRFADFLLSTAKVEAFSQTLLTYSNNTWDKSWYQRYPRRMTGQHLVAHYGVVGMMAALIEHGVDYDSLNSYIETPLIIAARQGHTSVVKLLLDTQTVKIDSMDNDGQTPLSHAAEQGHESIVRLLLNTQGVNIDSKDIWGQTPLLHTAEQGHESIVRLLLNTQGVDIDSKDIWGQTPLSYAAKQGHESILRLLLNTQGVNIESEDIWGQTPLLYAAEQGHKSVVKVLLDTQQINVDSKDDSGRTPLSYAAEKGNAEVVKLLLDTQQVDVDSKDNYGHTPLIRAAIRGREAIVRLLLDTRKADINYKDKFGGSALSWAEMKGYEAIIELLQDAINSGSAE